MLDQDFTLLETYPEWRQVLLAYSALTDSIPVTTGETTDLVAKGFRPRVKSVEGVAADQMTRIHGRLIAHGLLQVEIAGHTGGMLYQLTTHGRQACLRLASEPESVEEPELQRASA